MAKLECSLVSIYAPKSEKDALVSRLQEMSVMDIETATYDEETSALHEGYSKQETDDERAEYEKKANEADNAIKILDETLPEKKGLKDMFSGPRVVESNEFYLSEQKQAEIMADADELLTAYRNIAELKSESIRLNTMIDGISIWEGLDVPLSFTSTEKTAAFIGTVAGCYDLESLLSTIAEKLPEVYVHGEIISNQKDSTYIFVCCEKKYSAELEEVLRSLSFARPVNMSDEVPKVTIERYKEEIRKCEKLESQAREKIKEIAKRRREIELFADYCRSRAEKCAVMGEISATAHTVLIKGYVATVDLPELERVIGKEFTAVIESEAADETLAPVKLKNNSLWSPAETITQMYSLPSHKDIDPSPLTGFFYYLLFGMMLSDAGYGLLMIIGTLIVLKKFNPSPSMKKNMTLFLYCGISTVFWGLLFGSFFGDSVAVISRTFFGREISLPALIDPMNGGAVTLLLLSIAIGFIQIIAGLLAKFVTCIKNGDKAGAFFDAGLWITTLVGIAVFAIGILAVPVLKTAGAIIAIASVVGLILTQGRDKKNPVMRIFSGIASLYDITGYVSDLLSFSRLMALGLTTAAMGAVFNLLGTLGGNGIGGIITMIIIFPVGHLISFALNALGAYVHTLRLQYVELFSKFYDGGGREFKAFSIKNKYVGIKKSGETAK